MSREEVKTAISELLDNTPEQVLQEVFDYLKSVQGKSNDSISLSKNLRTILTEDKELLERLAK
ncbi:MAG: glutamate formiminotransferase [Roseivirga sp.]|jgi:glutamate formiminotransferase